jgi:PhnB protein
MRTNLNVMFPGTCDAAFTMYEQVFGVKRTFSMTFGETPGGSHVPAESDDLVMHASIPLGSMTLMGGDMPKGRERGLEGFKISLDMPDQAEVRRIFAALSEGGSVEMALAKTFWTELFGMCTDKFGVGWMVSVPGPEM